MATDDVDKGEWVRMPDAELLVRQAVGTWHQHLETAVIACVGRPKAGTKAGKVRWASLKKASPLERALSEDAPDYVVVIGLDIWAPLPDPLKLALVDHELCHGGGWDADAEAWTLAPHDIEEFAGVVQRHGAWRQDIAQFLSATRDVQLGLPLVDTAATSNGTKIDPRPPETVLSLLTDPNAPVSVKTAVDRLRPSAGSGIDSVTLETGGHRVVLHADGRTETS